MKRNAVNAYSMNGLVQFEPWIEAVVDRFCEIIDQNVNSQTVCDVGDLVNRFSPDAIYSLTFGDDSRYLEKGGYP